MPYANHICEDICMPLGFRVLWSYDEFDCKITVFESTSSDRYGSTPHFEMDEALIHPDRLGDPADTMCYMDGNIKYDGTCTLRRHEWQFNAPWDLVREMFLMQYLWNRSSELMRSIPNPNEIEYEDPLRVELRALDDAERYHAPPQPILIPTGAA